jgi:RHS repeat-associated protein
VVYDETAADNQGYKPWGEPRFGELDTEYQFTGQFNQAEIGLYYFNARWYDSSLGRMAQADILVPGVYNPQAWDRYAYVLNNPLRFIDPSGYEACLEVDSSGRCLTLKSALEQIEAEEDYKDRMIERYGEDYYPDIARQDYLYSLLFPGPESGQASWTAADWRYYYENRDVLWGNPSGDDTFPELVNRLLSHYSAEQKEQFVNDFALIFAGIPTVSSSPYSAAWASRNRPPLPIFAISDNGLQPFYLDSQGGENQSHHYAGSFFLGYYIGPNAATLVNIARDIDPFNFGDLTLGTVAAYDGWIFHLFPGISSVTYLIRFRWGK